MPSSSPITGVRTAWVRRAVRCAVGAVFLMAAGDSAFATCGDYLLHPAHDSTIAEGDSADLEAAMPDSDQPCDGPHCRQSPSIPVSPSVPVDRSPLTDHALLGAAAAEGDPSAPRTSTDADAAALRGFPLTIERPPRCA